MEVFLYNSNVCRLCGEENDNGNLLYTNEENNQNLCDIINGYLPIRVSDDGELPRTICPGCTIQLEATVEFLNLIINGQKLIRELYEREKEYRKTILKSGKEEPEVITENIVYEINTSDGVYHVEHPISLQVGGLEKPKRKRGRPPKKSKTPEELAAEAAAKEQQAKAQKLEEHAKASSGKRRRKTPTRFKEVVQGAELERMFKEEGVIEGEEKLPERREEPPREPEVIGHLETGGDLVLVTKGKGRGRPRGRMPQKREQCVICGMEFTCLGRYMSHVAQHGAVRYRCGCGQDFQKRLHFNDHQRDLDHTGLTVINSELSGLKPKKKCVKELKPVEKGPDSVPECLDLPVVDATVEPNVQEPGLPDINPDTVDMKQELIVVDDSPEDSDSVRMEPIPIPPIADTPSIDKSLETLFAETQPEQKPATKEKLKCNHCEKVFSNKQSKSLHIKAVHLGERPYACKECGAAFAYPRSLALHAAAHRRRAASSRGYACDLCGKVLNHPSSVVYHKQAAHAAQRYVCSSCGKRFRHKQLLHRHQLVHEQDRPYKCNICTATFKTKGYLTNHQLLHSGIKRFTCEICKHKFAHKTSLTLHMRWHSGVKPFVCGVCGKSFSQKGNLSEHERIHTGEKPFVCTQCPRRFTTSSQHRLHIRRHARMRANQAQREAGGAEAAGGAERGVGGAERGVEAGGAGAERGVHGCSACGGVFASRWALAQHSRAFGHSQRKPSQKQVSLLVNDKALQPEVVAPAIAVTHADAEAEADADADSDERVIYVAYDVDGSDAFHILDPEQAVNLDDSKVLTTCELYSGSSLLVSEELEMSALRQDGAPRLCDDAGAEPRLHCDDYPQKHIQVTDSAGNPLHFTMQDGTRLAITSADGHSLQVITQDGQTIPVEINGHTNEDELDTDMVVHQLGIEKGADSNSSSPVPTYFTLV